MLERLNVATNGVLKGGGSAVLPIGRGTRQVPGILEILARLQMTPAADLDDILKLGIKLPWGTTGVGLTYDSGVSCRDIVAFFNYRKAPMVSIVSRREPAPAGDKTLKPVYVLTLEEICGGSV